MRAKEFINEANKIGKVKKMHVAVQQGIKISRDNGGYDRTNYLNRKWMACAMADGKNPNKGVDMDGYSWVERFNSEHPFTKEEYNMLRQAEKTVPGEVYEITPWSKSQEPDDTHKVSPVPNRDGKKKKK